MAATLASIAPAVDLLVVNDNSGLERSENHETLARSAFARGGRLVLVRRPFVDFAQMRNCTLEVLAGLERPPDWVLHLDADEVHGTQIAGLARRILPRLSPKVVALDAYTYNFFGTFDWISDLSRRFIFFRFAPHLRWRNQVHEKLFGLDGTTVVAPYAYHHYGNVASPEALARKHGRYYDLGNRVPPPPLPEAATLELFLARAADVRPFRGSHPAQVRRLLAELRARNGDLFDALDRGFRERRGSADRLRGRIAGFHERARVELRRLERRAWSSLPTIAR
ncbi:MAG: hypothetical protein ACREM2_06265 [Vulcanimicrobiaceae bacterium]